MIKCIIFDLGGVLVDFSDEKYYRYISKISKKSPEAIKKKVEPWLWRLYIGATKVQLFEKDIARSFSIPLSKVRWVQFYEEKVRPKKDVIAILRKLRKRYVIAFISNIDSSRYDVRKAEIEHSMFDYKFASSFVKLSKPDPEIFKYALKRMRIQPGEAVFIDDRRINVISARSVGIPSILFRGSKDLEKKLKRMKVL